MKNRIFLQVVIAKSDLSESGNPFKAKELFSHPTVEGICCNGSKKCPNLEVTTFHNKPVY